MGRAKDWMIEQAAPALLNQSLLKPYGRLTQFKFDSAQRAMEGELELIGESQPVQITLKKFELLSENGEAFIVIHDMTTSREWLTTLAREHLIGRRFKLPSAAAKYAGMLL